MADERTDKRRPPSRGRARPRTPTGEQPAVRVPVRAGLAPDDPTARRPRLTGRTAVLVLVVAVLAVSYASSMRAYLEQRAHIGELKAQIAERQVSIARLAREKERWSDPAFQAQQARERFGYVMPGDTSYVVLDEDGQALEPESSLSDREPVDPQTQQAWWARGWESVRVAGDPPAPEAPPATRIDGTR